MTSAGTGTVIGSEKAGAGWRLTAGQGDETAGGETDNGTEGDNGRP